MPAPLAQTELQTSIELLITEAEALVKESPEWDWPSVNLQLCRELHRLALQGVPNGDEVAEFAGRYRSEMRRCHGRASLLFLDCLAAIQNGNREPVRTGPKIWVPTHAQWAMLPGWQRLTLIILSGVVSVLGRWGGRRYSGGWWPHPYIHGAAAVLAIPLLVLSVMMTRQARIFARRERNGQCVACGYDLRATPDRCPECGQAR